MSLARTTSLAGALALSLSGLALAQDVALDVKLAVPGGQETPLENATVLIKGGKVAEVSHAVDVPAGIRRLDRRQTWAVPGMIDPLTALGALGDDNEADGPLVRGLTTVWSRNPNHEDFVRARAAGITTCGLTPGYANLYGGSGVVLDTGGKLRSGALRLARLSIGPQSIGTSRPPTSRGGAWRLLTAAIREAHSSEQGGDDFSAFAKGEIPGLVSVVDGRDVRDFLALGKQLGLRLVFHTDEDMAPADFEGIELAGTTFVIGPYSMNSSSRAMRLPAYLVGKGAKLAFTGGAPDNHPAALRLTAALAVRHGLPQAEAWKALTETPAGIVGLGGEVGTLSPTSMGDVVLFDGHPLELTSRVVEVYLGGRLVHRGPQPKQKVTQ